MLRVLACRSASGRVSQVPLSSACCWRRLRFRHTLCSQSGLGFASPTARYSMLGSWVRLGAGALLGQSVKVSSTEAAQASDFVKFAKLRPSGPVTVRRRCAAAGAYLPWSTRWTKFFVSTPFLGNTIVKSALDTARNWNHLFHSNSKTVPILGRTRTKFRLPTNRAV